MAPLLIVRRGVTGPAPPHASCWAARRLQEGHPCVPRRRSVSATFPSPPPDHITRRPATVAVVHPGFEADHYKQPQQGTQAVHMIPRSGPGPTSAINSPGALYRSTSCDPPICLAAQGSRPRAVSSLNCGPGKQDPRSSQVLGPGPTRPTQNHPILGSLTDHLSRLDPTSAAPMSLYCGQLHR